jgi:hypothetical protein
MSAWVVFSDLMMVNEDADPGDDGYWLQVPPSLRGYSYRAGDTGPIASTVHGITVGSTVKDLRALGDIVTLGYDACGDIVGFTIADSGGTNEGQIWGNLEGTDPEAFEESGHLNPEATVQSLRAGAQSSC